MKLQHNTISFTLNQCKDNKCKCKVNVKMIKGTVWRTSRQKVNFTVGLSLKHPQTVFLKKDYLRVPANQVKALLGAHDFWGISLSCNA